MPVQEGNMDNIEQIIAQLSVAECAVIIGEHYKHLSPKDQVFALDLARRANAKSFSDKQAFWLRKMTARIQENMTAPKERKSVEIGAMAGIIGMFNKVAAKSKNFRAAVVLDDGSQAIRLSIAGPTSKMPGTVNVTTNGSFENRTWFGRILENGSFEMSSRQETPDSVVALLRRFSADPVTVAAEHGKRTGSCCFCNRELNDKRSIEVGYGPVCADKFGLEWGSSKAA